MVKKIPLDTLRDKFFKKNPQPKKDADSAELSFPGETILARGEHCSLRILNLIPYAFVAILVFVLAQECIGSFLYWNDLYYLGELAVVMVAAVLICYLIHKLTAWRCANEHFLITSKRVSYRFCFRQMDLPLDMVSAVGTHLLWTLTVSTPSGVIRIPFLKNYKALHKTLVSLLISRQGSTQSAADPDDLDMADEIPDLSDMFDDSILSEMIPSDIEWTSDEEIEPAIAEEEQPLPEGYRIGRCVMCRRIELPVKTISVTISGVARQRTLCEACAQKQNAN